MKREKEVQAPKLNIPQDSSVPFSRSGKSLFNIYIRGRERMGGHAFLNVTEFVPELRSDGSAAA